MSELTERLKALEGELHALQRIKTQEDFDEGARLHAEKNAPWVKGQYSDQKFEPYQYRAYPKMLFDEHYEAACLAYDQACMIPARGVEDRERATAMLLAERQKAIHCRIVKTPAEHEALGSGWYESPVAALEAVRRRNDEIAQVAAHRAYEDRNMSAGAKAEAAKVEDAAETFVPEIPETKRGPRSARP